MQGHQTTDREIDAVLHLGQAQPVLSPASPEAPAKQLLRLRFQLRLIFLDERANLVSHVEQPNPLLLVERHREPAQTVNRNGPFFAYLQADGS